MAFELSRSIPSELRARLDAMLMMGESVRWMGSPVRRYFTPASTRLFFFSFFWIAGAAYWTISMTGPRVPDFTQSKDVYAIPGAIFAGLGLVMMASPLWVRWKASATLYAVTDQRAMIIEGGWHPHVQSFPPLLLSESYVEEEKEGTGDVIITSRHRADSDGDLESEDIGFLGISNPRSVLPLLLELAREADQLGSGGME